MRFLLVYRNTAKNMATYKTDSTMATTSEPLERYHLRQLLRQLKLRSRLLRLYRRAVTLFGLGADMREGHEFDRSKFLVACDWLQEQDGGDELGELIRRNLARTEPAELWYGEIQNLPR